MSKTEILVDEWIARGYRRHDFNKDDERARIINKNSDFILQKRFDDSTGKKYFITVYVYNRLSYPVELRQVMPEYGFMPTAHFSLRDAQPFFNIEMNSPQSIDQVESYFEMFWDTLNRPYYEKF